MAGPYVVNIANGTGAKDVLSGSYAVTAAVTGYSNVSVLPATQVIGKTAAAYPFTIAATGTLTLHVSETGASGGKAVVGATFVRCDSAGNTYGTPILSDASGNVVFNNVPYAATGAPLIYYKQTVSDGNHEFVPDLANTSLTVQTGTVEVENPLPTTKTITLTDINYTGLPIEVGTLTLT